MNGKYTLFILFIILAQALAACGTGMTATPATEPPAVPTSLPTSEPMAEPTAAPEPTPAPAVEFVRSIVGNPNPISKPIAITLDAQDNLYVLEAGSCRVQVFDSNGEFLRMWGSPGEGDGQFRLNHPNAAGLAADGYVGLDAYGDIAVDAHGNVYVMDTSQLPRSEIRK